MNRLPAALSLLVAIATGLLPMPAAGSPDVASSVPRIASGTVFRQDIADAWLRLHGRAQAPLSDGDLAEFRRLLTDTGWPTAPVAGAAAIDAAGDLLARASADYGYQQEVIDLVSSRVGIDVDALAVARLNDRIERDHRGTQQFGTLFALEHGRVVPAVPARGHLFYRDFYGLPSMDDVIDTLQAGIDAGRSLAELDPPRSLAAPYTPLTHTELRRELGRMVAADQDARHAYAQSVRAGTPDPALQEAVARADADNHARVAQILDTVGFPGPEMVGRDGVSTFFLLVQHADDDPALQQRALALAEPLMRERRMSRQQFAMLTDRVLLAQGLPQRYGTQTVTDETGTLVLAPVENAAGLDARRRDMAMGTAEAYLELLRARHAAP